MQHRNAATLDAEIGTLVKLQSSPRLAGHVARGGLDSQAVHAAVRDGPWGRCRNRRDRLGKAIDPAVRVGDNQDLGLRLRERSIDRRRFAPCPRVVLPDGNLPTRVLLRVTRGDELKGTQTVRTVGSAPRDNYADGHATGAGSKISERSRCGSATK